MTLTRSPKLRRPLSLGEVGWPESLASPSSTIRTRRNPSLSPTSTRSIYHRYTTAIDFEETQSLPSRRRGRSTSPRPHVLWDRPIPTAYASLPPSPVLRTCSPTPPSILPIPQSNYADVQQQEFQPPPFSLWDYLREELLATDFDSHQELKWERVRNFLNIPLAMEKVGILPDFTSI